MKLCKNKKKRKREEPDKISPPPCQNPLPRILKCTSAKNTSWRYWGTPAGIIQISDQGDGAAYRRAGGGEEGLRGCGDGENSWRKTTTVEVWQRRSAVIINSCQGALKLSPDRSAVPNGSRFLAACFFCACLLCALHAVVCARMRVRVYKSATVRFPLFHLYSEACALVDCRSVHVCVK